MRLVNRLVGVHLGIMPQPLFFLNYMQGFLQCDYQTAQKRSHHILSELSISTVVLTLDLVSVQVTFQLVLLLMYEGIRTLITCTLLPNPACAPVAVGESP